MNEELVTDDLELVRDPEGTIYLLPRGGFELPAPFDLYLTQRAYLVVSAAGEVVKNRFGAHR